MYSSCIPWMLPMPFERLPMKSLLPRLIVRKAEIRHSSSGIVPFRLLRYTVKCESCKSPISEGIAPSNSFTSRDSWTDGYKSSVRWHAKMRTGKTSKHPNVHKFLSDPMEVGIDPVSKLSVTCRRRDQSRWMSRFEPRINLTKQ